MKKSLIIDLKNDIVLHNHCYQVIEDAGVSIRVEERLGESDYVGVKVDDYFNERRSRDDRPKSVDFVVVVRDGNNKYILYVMELKGGKRRTSPREIIEKFDGTLDSFIEKDYHHLFCNDSVKYSNIHLIWVTTQWKKSLNYKNFEEFVRIREKIYSKDTVRIEAKIDKVYCFRGHRCEIRKEIPAAVVIGK